MSDGGHRLREECTAENVEAWIRENGDRLGIVNDDILLSRRHYVYILLRAGGLIPFYVGLGEGPRWKSHWLCRDSNYHKVGIIKQLVNAGIPKEDCVIFAQKNLTRGQSGILETALIAAIGRVPHGPLVNLSDGGEASALGYKWTPEQKKILNELTWITNGIDSIKVSKWEEIPEGWWRARKFTDDHLAAVRASNATALHTPETIAIAQAARQVIRDNAPVRVWINDGRNNRQIEPSEPIPDGWISGHALSEDGRATVVAAAKKQFTSEEAARRIRLGWENPESRAKLEAARQNQMWITDGVTNRRLPEGSPVPDGWTQSRTVKIDGPRRWISSGTSNRKLAVTEPLPDGWQEGRTEGMFKPTVWITDGSKGQRLPVGDPVPDGWYVGFPPRKPKAGPATPDLALFGD